MIFSGTRFGATIACYPPPNCVSSAFLSQIASRQPLKTMPCWQPVARSGHVYKWDRWRRARPHWLLVCGLIAVTVGRGGASLLSPGYVPAAGPWRHCPVRVECVRAQLTRRTGASSRRPGRSPRAVAPGGRSLPAAADWCNDADTDSVRATGVAAEMS